MIFLFSILFSFSGSTQLLDQGTAALLDFQAEKARLMLEQARDDGPYRYEDYVRLYEQLAIAYIYLDQQNKALDAFDMLLTLNPNYVISYTLSPKVTFVFEEARALAAKRYPPTIQLNWPLNLKIDSEVGIDVQVVSDPKKYFNIGILHYRLKGDPQYRAKEFAMSSAGRNRRIILPPFAAEKSSPQVLELHLTVLDKQGNQVYRIGQASHPRTIELGYDPPQPWYRKWWVWAAVGGVVAVGTGLAVGIALYDPPESISGSFQ